MKIRTILILCILFKTGLSYSQNKISGKIIDKLGEPLPFVNIILYQSESKKVITGTSSDFDGNYRFENILDGNYYVEVSSLGFKTQRKEPFLLSKKEKSKELNFVLEEDSQTLDEVVIKSRKPVIRQI